MLAHYSDQYVLPLPPGHRFPMAKYRLLRDRIAAELPGVRLVQAPPASDGELALAHEPQWIAAVAAGTLSAAQQREIGFPWSEAMVERSRRSVGATIAAARAALHEGVAANLAGGTHHAYADKGSGYCVFNDIAVAARLMQAEWHRTQPPARRSLLRVAVIDLDVHQGNGTAAIFRDDPTVFTLSMHGEKNFPFRKEAGDLDVDLPDGCTDVAYLKALDGALATLWARHGDTPPSLVFYLAGADPHEGDRLGRLKISAEGLAERDRRVFQACRERGIPVVLTMGGGYGRDIDATVAVQLATYREALACWAGWPSIGLPLASHNDLMDQDNAQPDIARIVEGAITSRRSVRAFLPTPVPRVTIEHLLDVAARAPSGTNIQPWKVTVLTGDALARLSAAILAVHDDPSQMAEHSEEYAYYPRQWVAPYIDRRRKIGWDLYGLLGIGKADKARMHAQNGRNFSFFGAPVGLIFTIDRILEQGSWLDYGMFLQNLMVAARGHGLDTCPQAAFTTFHRVIARELALPEGEMLVCGMSLGYADPQAIENTLVTEREPTAGFARFLDR